MKVNNYLLLLPSLYVCQSQTNIETNSVKETQASYIQTYLQIQMQIQQFILNSVQVNIKVSTSISFCQFSQQQQAFAQKLTFLSQNGRWFEKKLIGNQTPFKFFVYQIDMFRLMQRLFMQKRLVISQLLNFQKVAKLQSNYKDFQYPNNIGEVYLSMECGQLLKVTTPDQ